MVFPAEAYAEKEGTIVHPDGRIQRLRPAVARGRVGARGVAGARRSGPALGTRPRRPHRLDGLAQLFDAVPFYAGLTLEEIGGRGVRWQERDAAGAYPVKERV